MLEARCQSADDSAKVFHSLAIPSPVVLPILPIGLPLGTPILSLQLYPSARARLHDAIPLKIHGPKVDPANTRTSPNVLQFSHASLAFV